MVGRILMLILCCALASGGNICHAQSDPQGKSSAPVTGPRRHLANIVFAGLAGAVLGLSTLSFYGRPQDRLSNIAVGFAIGVIGGTLFSTYKAAVEPREFYGLDNKFELRAENVPTAKYVFEF